MKWGALMRRAQVSGCLMSLLFVFQPSSLPPPPPSPPLLPQEWPLEKLAPLHGAVELYQSHKDEALLLPRHAQLFVELLASLPGCGRSEATWRSGLGGENGEPRVGVPSARTGRARGWGWKGGRDKRGEGRVRVRVRAKVSARMREDKLKGGVRRG